VDGRLAAVPSRAEEVREVESSWESRDLPVLDAVVHYLDEHVDAIPDVAQIAVITGRDPAEVHQALRAMEGHFIHVPDMSVGADAQNYFVDGVTPQARRAVGQWPSPEVWVDRLVQALREAAEREPDPERRGRLRAMAEGLGGFARDVAVGVLSGGITQSMGS
jgi:hypothetical protein